MAAQSHLQIINQSSAFDFSMSKDFSISTELPRVNFSNNMKIEPQHKWLPRIFPMAIRPHPRLKHRPDLLTFI